MRIDLLPIEFLLLLQIWKPHWVKVPGWKEIQVPAWKQIWVSVEQLAPREAF